MGSNSESEKNKSIVRRHLDEIFGQGDPSVLAQIMAPATIWHTESDPPGEATPKSILKGRADRMAAFPDCHLFIEDMMAEGDRVAVRARVTGTHRGRWNSAGGFLRTAAPSGNKFDIQVQMIYRLNDQRIVERWVVHDWLGMLQQLGALVPQEKH